MKDNRCFVLVAITDNALIGHWSLAARDERAVARHLLENVWSYEKVFWGLHIPLEAAAHLGADDVLRAIDESYGRPRGRAVFYLLPITQPALCDTADPVPTGELLATLPVDRTEAVVPVP